MDLFVIIVLSFMGILLLLCGITIYIKLYLQHNYYLSNLNYIKSIKYSKKRNYMKDNLKEVINPLKITRYK